MRFHVAFLTFLTVFGSVAIAQRQPQRQNKSAVNKPPSETLRICQGVPIPDGYVIVAYMTSSACAHGAYIIKKQANYESSIGVNGAARPAGDDSSSSAKSSGAQSPRT